ncbi:uncharacterized protein TNCV_2094591 [Trichonephila clavipes]|nr:uncharacterized protein TNCV_2094591 [Trichonephila clavipes]
MKTVTYRPQSNLTERVNRSLVQMIASFVEENHENWDQFLHFAFALRTAVNETTNKTPAELFLGRKIITPFSKLINVTEDAKYVGRNFERLFDEARRNMQKSISLGKKYYNLRRRDVHIKVNDLVLLQTHFLSAAGRKQVRVYRPRQSDTISSDSPVETLYDEQEVSHGSNRSHQGQFKEHRKTSSQERVESIAGPSRLPDRRTATTTGGSRMEVSGRDNQTRQPRATTRGRNKQAEKPVRSNQANTRRPCPYYLRSRIQENDGIPEELSNIEINGIPHSTLRRRSLSMEALDGDPVHRI